MYVGDFVEVHLHIYSAQCKIILTSDYICNWVTTEVYRGLVYSVDTVRAYQQGLFLNIFVNS